ncbi:MAG: carbohydrate kinase family protein [Erysipelotrichaceae bacterium]
MKKVLLIGSTTTDVTMEIDHLPGIEEDINPRSQILSLGGCASNVAWVLKHFNVPFTLASPVGKGLYGDFVRNELNKRNIDIWKESDEVNGSCICLITKDGNRTFLAYHGAEYHFYKEWFDSLDVSEYELAYISGIDIEEEVNECIIEFLEESKLPFVFACGPRINCLNKERLNRLLKLNPILHLNKREAMCLTDDSDLLNGLYKLNHNIVIITDGANGTLAYDGNKKVFVPSLKVKQLDGTGAGDSHIGTVIVCLMQGMDLEDSLKKANEVASKVIGVKGPVLPEELF